MRYFYTILIVFLFASEYTLAQENIANRIIFIGDAGEINFKQETIIPRAAELVIDGKTQVVYLGDNIYPRGIGLPGSPEEASTKDILRSQFEPMRAQGAPVFFIPGNHDWDRMGKDGLAKIKAQGEFLRAQGDSLLKLIPEDGCPGPVEVPISAEAVMVAYDSEWWLFPYDTSSPDSDCECTTEEEFIDRLEELLYKNRNKTILLSSHHPFHSYGVHGGYYSFKDHLFPLTVLDENLWIPMPIVGSLYPLLRTSVFLNPEDMPHPKYQNLISKVTDVVSGFPNVILIAGHEHGLQFIRKDGNYQIVSGSGAKSAYVKKADSLLYGSSLQGFVTVDLLENRNTDVSFYLYNNDSVSQSFKYTIQYIDESLIDEHSALNDIKGDSIVIQANPRYNKRNNFHRKLFGENYRKEWAAETKVPILRISEIEGGLTPIKRGGGMQTVSIRLQDSTGKQWVLRSVNKNSESLLPSELHHTFASDFIDDAVSAQHPYSALMVPPIANAAKVPHTNPVIGWVAPDSLLGVYNLTIANTLNLLEEREPLGDSDNSIKMVEKVFNDNDDTFGAKTFFRSRLLDLLIGDWDRHEDQYRWVDEKEGKDKDYRVVPRDRDQVIRLMEGLFPSIVSRKWAVPTIQGFDDHVRNMNYSMYKSDFLDAHPKMQLSYDEWMSLTNEFVANVTDSVLWESVHSLPSSSVELRGKELFKTLSARRDAIPEAMDEYYQFVNSIVDIRLSNKNERVKITDETDGAMRILVNKINKEGEIKKELMNRVYHPDTTKRINLYLSDGVDSVAMDAPNSPIRLRIVGGQENKVIDIKQANKKVHLYDLAKTNSTYLGDKKQLKTHISADSTHTRFEPVNLYNVTMPLASIGYNLDDGILLGAGFKYVHQRGFRKTPFTHSQKVLVSGALKTGSFKVDYEGHWKNLIGKADLVVNAYAFVPNNTQNFFGLGNDSQFDKSLNSSYYRARFNLYELEPTLQWNQEGRSFKIGPSFQYYSLDPSKNEGRLILQEDILHSHDRYDIEKDKSFAGLTSAFHLDNRNHHLLPTQGGFFSSKAKAYAGLNDASNSFVQVSADMGFYKGFANNAIVIADRIGGGVTFGDPAFYQLHFLGGQDNLLGTRKYRYAGNHMFYNNFETRIRLAKVGSFILPGQLGLIGFYDLGKVWSEGYNSNTIHQTYGGGLYYAPAMMAVFQLVAGHSQDGWYPHFSMGFRF